MHSLDWQPIISRPAVGRRSFLDALAERFPTLAEELGRAEAHLELIDVADTKDAGFLVRENGWHEEGMLVPPNRLVERRAAQAGALRKAVDDGARLIVIAGVGIGDVCREILRLLPGRTNVGFLIVEHELVRVLIAATLYDLSPLARSENVLWALGTDAPDQMLHLCREKDLFLIPVERREYLLGAIPASVEEAQRYTMSVTCLPRLLESELDAFERSVQRFVARSREAPKSPGLVWSYHSPRAHIHLPLLQALLSGFEERGWRTRCELATDDFTCRLRLAASVVRAEPDAYLFLNGPSRAYLSEAGISAAAEREIERPRVIWIVDDLSLSGSDDLRTGYTFRDRVFCADRTYLSQFNDSGAGSVSFLPAGPSLFRLGRSSPEWSAPICFVGSIQDMTPYLHGLSAKAQEWAQRVIVRKEQQRAVPFRQIVDAEKPSQSILDEVRNAAQAYVATTPKQIGDPNQILDYFLYVVCNYSYRRRVIECLLPLGLRVFGPKSWLTVLPANDRDRYGGFVPFENAADAYASADLCLNLHSFQCPTCLNSRDFDVVMAGGCLLADWVEDYDQRFFAPESEVALFRSDDELLEKAQSLLSDPDRRESMKAASRQRLLAEHTYAHRADVILRALGSRRGDTLGES